ncbi:MAG: antitoxin family protein [Gemmataceae bacterium]|nr:antitoxin family protein [Gemmataceae bacterium]MCI0738287.1 antitoxin family protein [Gemmataceae bacterium]
MPTVEAIYVSGVFKPLADVQLPENQRVRLIVEAMPTPTVGPWLNAVQSFQQQLMAAHGVFSDSTPDIAADHRRHE